MCKCVCGWGGGRDSSPPKISTLGPSVPHPSSPWGHGNSPSLSCGPGDYIRPHQGSWGNVSPFPIREVLPGIWLQALLLLNGSPSCAGSLTLAADLNPPWGPPPWLTRGGRWVAPHSCILPPHPPVWSLPCSLLSPCASLSTGVPGRPVWVFAVRHPPSCPPLPASPGLSRWPAPSPPPSGPLLPPGQAASLPPGKASSSCLPLPGSRAPPAGASLAPALQWCGGLEHLLPSPACVPFRPVPALESANMRGLACLLGE